MHSSEEPDDRDTTLLGDEQQANGKKKQTPLPLVQLSIVYLVQFAEPITATVIYPFINQLVRETGITGGDERKTGYFAGIIQSVFFFAEAVLVVPWGMASDRYGRRPVLLLGPLGLAIVMLGFGMSTAYWPLVAFRCMQGAFNGNIGVSKSIVGEITDSTNIADAFAFTPAVWASGVTIGPFIGGLLSDPATRWPQTFGKIPYFKTHPYFLPCLVASFLSLSIFLMALAALKETLPSAMVRQKQKLGNSGPSTTSLISDDDAPRYGSIGSSHLRTGDSSSTIENGDEPLSLRDDPTPSSLPSLLKLPVVRIILINYAFLGFCDMSVQVLTPLMWSTSIEHGGLGLSPYTIGVTMGAYGVLNAFLQILFLGKFIKRFGPRRVHIACFSSLLISFSSFPIAAFFARRANGTDWQVWTMIIVSLAAQSMRSGAYGEEFASRCLTWIIRFERATGSLMVIITGSAPSQSSLGAMNGLSQAVGSITRSLGPSFASSLHSISLQQQLAGGNAVYYIMMIIVAFGIRFTFMLPGRLHHS
ncbi:hypothetical protein AX15_006703 [Amanita polypyramis BW_CC]|nr:hypothetical protein AX15_006703 [Amanita polypyramis BW_CC]